MKRFSNLVAVAILVFAGAIGLGLISIEFYHHLTIVDHPFETKRWAWGVGLALFSATALQLGSVKAAAEEAKLVFPVVFSRAGRRDADPVVAATPAPIPVPTAPTDIVKPDPSWTVPGHSEGSE